MAAQPASRLDKIITRVQGLLAQAASTTFVEEADTFRAKADELMTSYAIKEWQLEKKAGTATRRPTYQTIDMSWYWETKDEEIAQAIYRVFWETARHCRCEPAFMATDYHKRTMPIVGMEGDIEYMKIIFTDLFRQMLETMDPHPRGGEPMIEALVRMKEAGMKWEDIFHRLRQYGYYPADMTWSPSRMDYAGKYREYCIRNKRKQVKTTPSVYRRSFTFGFVLGVSEKFRKMRQDQGLNTGSRALALKDYKQEVTDALYEFFPKHRPQAINVVATSSKSSRRRAAPKPKKMDGSVIDRAEAEGANVNIIPQHDYSRQRTAGELG